MCRMPCAIYSKMEKVSFFLVCVLLHSRMMRTRWSTVVVCWLLVIWQLLIHWRILMVSCYLFEFIILLLLAGRVIPSFRSIKTMLELTGHTWLSCFFPSWLRLPGWLITASVSRFWTNNFIPITTRLTNIYCILDNWTYMQMYLHFSLYSRDLDLYHGYHVSLSQILFTRIAVSRVWDLLINIWCIQDN